jgi:signal transduction histidine kinase
VNWRPLDRVGSIKLKLGLVIVGAVAVSSTVSIIGFRLGVPLWLRPIIASALALALVQVVAKGMTSPLREMARAASRMAAGEHDVEVRASAADEVGQLARAFNAMAAELVATDRVRRDLVANVSHELRTPIGALQARLENLVDGVEPNEPEVLEAMLAQVERLGRLVAQLLDLSRLESGVVPLERRPFPVRSVLEDAAREARLAAPGTDVEVDAPAGLLVDGDAERVHQVVANLVANAIRHSPAGAPVQLVGRADPAGVVIEVRDRGPGIAPGDATRVFERFYRADAARSSGEGGAGLGLAIARWIVDLHGGAIEARPNDPHGCRMVVVLAAA